MSQRSAPDPRTLGTGRDQTSPAETASYLFVSRYQTGHSPIATGCRRILPVRAGCRPDPLATGGRQIFSVRAGTLRAHFALGRRRAPPVRVGAVRGPLALGRRRIPPVRAVQRPRPRGCRPSRRVARTWRRPVLAPACSETASCPGYFLSWPASRAAMRSGV
jgi:hypothetical protein